MATELTYYITEGLLAGYANGGLIHISALTGGGGGSTRRQPTSWGNNPYGTGFKTRTTGKAHIHGGPLPVGNYRIHPPKNHPHLGRSCFLEPVHGNRMYGRGGFFIHGRGKHGSDGCIVPLDHFQFLLDQIERDKGGVLHVFETMEVNTRFA